MCDEERPDKDTYYMDIAKSVSKRATCRRRKVGAVLVVDDRIVSTGYNGAPKGLPHCTTIGCDMDGGHCVRCVHAEANALIQAGSAGLSTAGTTLYTTASPCKRCMGLIINAKVKRVVYAEPYQDITHGTDENDWAHKIAGCINMRLDRWKPKGRELA